MTSDKQNLSWALAPLLRRIQHSSVRTGFVTDNKHLGITKKRQSESVKPRAEDENKGLISWLHQAAVL